MPCSFARTTQLTCPQCKLSFNFETWLIVDTSERPDLLERVIQGSLHTSLCPNCGREIDKDDALLIFRPDDEPHLVFSPARQSSKEDSQQVA